ncbi:hypothetical protein [Phenylobacterium sp.]|uniref:hypothetical protein n=1 Tax=Phenylobacterium sp. TaxID=1871053 RepID=UPI0025F81638|nr:hypothetical protein [Phenylobacterium sp.]
MAASILYAVLAFYGLLILAANAFELAKSGPDAWTVFQTTGGAALLILAGLGFANRVPGRLVAAVVAVLIGIDLGWRLLT